MDNKVLEALKKELEKTQEAPTEAEEYQYPSNLRNLLLEKVGLPRALGVSKADEKRWAQQFPQMAAEGSINLGEPLFSKLRETLNKPAISKPVLSPAIESLAEDLKAGRQFTKVPSKAEIAEAVNPTIYKAPDQQPSEFMRRLMDKMANQAENERKMREFLEATKKQAIESGSAKEPTVKINGG